MNPLNVCSVPGFHSRLVVQENVAEKEYFDANKDPGDVSYDMRVARWVGSVGLARPGSSRLPALGLLRPGSLRTGPLAGLAGVCCSWKAFGPLRPRRTPAADP